MPSPSTLTPEHLTAIRNSDPEAWQKLVEEYYSFVYKICRRKNIGPDDSADICQEVFRSIFKSLPNFQKTERNHSFRGWITTITQRRISDFFSNLGDAPLGIGGSDAQSLFSEISAPGGLSESSHSLGNILPRAYNPKILESVRCEFEHVTWEAFWLVVVEGKSVAEIAEKLQITPNSVYLAKSRILKRLRAALQAP